MANEVDLCNQALGLVAEQRIMALSENSQLGRLCSLHFGPSVREVLRDGQWRCARRRVILAPLAESPAFEWAYGYQLPGDFIRLIRLNGEDVGSPDMPLFEIEGRRLLTDTDEVRMVYIRDVTMLAADAAGLADLDPLCARAMTVLLASKLAWALQQSRTLRDGLLEEYQAVLARAKTANSRDAWERTIEPGLTSRWLGVR